MSVNTAKPVGWPKHTGNTQWLWVLAPCGYALVLHYEMVRRYSDGSAAVTWETPTDPLCM